VAVLEYTCLCGLDDGFGLTINLFFFNLFFMSIFSFSLSSLFAYILFWLFLGGGGAGVHPEDASSYRGERRGIYCLSMLLLLSQRKATCMYIRFLINFAYCYSFRIHCSCSFCFLVSAVGNLRIEITDDEGPRDLAITHVTNALCLTRPPSCHLSPKKFPFTSILSRQTDIF
jgi:hypothetical protein